MRYFLISLFIILQTSTSASSLQDSSRLRKDRFYPVVVGMNAAYVGAIFYLSEAWYKDQQRSTFHFFNDWPEWKQMDKAGHITTAFHQSAAAVEILQWTGVSRKRSILYGGLAGFIYQFPIEILDGFSDGYGASLSDLAANATGSLMVLGQYYFWDQLRVQTKYSFSPSGLAHLNPDLLGRTTTEQLIKDYNAQTYWLSTNISTFLPQDSKFPRWLNISFGYSAMNMVRARDHQNVEMGFRPYRQYFLSFDIDVRHTRIRSKWIRTILYPLNIIHIPFPAVELNRKGLKFHPLYF